MRPTVAINVTCLNEPQTGVGRYTRHLTEELLRTGEIELVLFDGHRWSSLSPVGDSSIKPGSRHSLRRFLKPFVPYYQRLGELVRDALFQYGATRRKPHLYHEPNFIPYRFDGPTVITVHDLSVIKHPEFHPKARIQTIGGSRLGNAIHNSDAIITVSEQVRKDLLESFDVDENRVVAVSNGVSTEYRPIEEPVARQAICAYQLRWKEYVLFVGTLEPRKNVLRLIEAYTRLPAVLQRKYPLVLAGGRGWLVDEIQRRLGSRGHEAIRLLNYVPECDLPMLYSGATVFAYPSLYEGFGLPVLEAMACGTPVITSKGSAMEEVAGDAAMYVDPIEVQALTSAMEMLLDSAPTMEMYANRGIARATEFTWERTARDTLAVYNNILTR